MSLRLTPIPPNACFVLLRRTRIRRVPPALPPRVASPPKALLLQRRSELRSLPTNLNSSDNYQQHQLTTPAPQDIRSSTNDENSLGQQQVASCVLPTFLIILNCHGMQARWDKLAHNLPESHNQPAWTPRFLQCERLGGHEFARAAELRSYAVSLSLKCPLRRCPAPSCRMP